MSHDSHQDTVQVPHAMQGCATSLPLEEAVMIVYALLASASQILRVLGNFRASTPTCLRSQRDASDLMLVMSAGFKAVSFIMFSDGEITPTKGRHQAKLQHKGIEPK